MRRRQGARCRRTLRGRLFGTWYRRSSQDGLILLCQPRRMESRAVSTTRSRRAGSIVGVDSANSTRARWSASLRRGLALNSSATPLGGGSSDISSLMILRRCDLVTFISVATRGDSPTLASNSSSHSENTLGFLCAELLYHFC